jgi:diadenosine tetraphosphate (Ap4A) HIT family hydrolase
MIQTHGCERYSNGYCEDCCGCKRSREKNDGVIEMEGDWILNHIGESKAFLGWLIMQPKYHRMDFASLKENEARTLGTNIQKVDNALHEYWQRNFPSDCYERTYVVYFFESAFNCQGEKWHMHIHLIPRTKRLGTDGFGKYRPWDVAAWNIVKVKDFGFYPDEYKRENDAGKSKEKELMQYLKKVGKSC